MTQSGNNETLTICLDGDVMTGRGIDQILPHPGNPVLYEPVVRDAREYVDLAQKASGPIRKPVGVEYIWGDAIRELTQVSTALRIINLETAVAARGEPWHSKFIHYRMHPQNIGCLTAAEIDCCCLANNHVMDWGRVALAETLQTLEGVRIKHAGAGRNASEAGLPVVFDMPGPCRALVFSMGEGTSGIPDEWRATPSGPGIDLVDDLSERAAAGVAARIRKFSRPGDVTVVSIHWGDNWGYAIPAAQIRFAHRLIDDGVSVVYGHSSHHFKAIEVYRQRLVLYGCGDFVNDYEGIRGKEEYRSDLRLLYQVRLEPSSGKLEAVRLVPFRVSRFALRRAAPDDVRWVCDVLGQQGAPFGTRVQVQPDGSITLLWRTDRERTGP